MHTPVEYFLASDPSAVIEHTNRVLFLEDYDVAAIEVRVGVLCGCGDDVIHLIVCFIPSESNVAGDDMLYNNERTAILL